MSPQEITATDAKGNKVRWDGTRWVPVAPAPKPAQVVDKIVTKAPEQKPRFVGGLEMVGEKPEDLKSFKDLIQGFGSAISGLAAFPVSVGIAGALSSKGIDPALSEQIGQHAAGKISVKPTTPGSQALSTALMTPFAPFAAGIEGAAKGIYPKSESGQASVRTGLGLALLAYPLAKGIVKGFIKGRAKAGMDITPKELDAIASKMGPKELAAWEAKKLGTETPAFRDKTSGKVYAGEPGETNHAQMMMRLKELNIDNLESGWIKKDGSFATSIEVQAQPSSRLQSPPVPTGDPIADALALDKFNAAQRAREAARPLDSPGITPAPPAGIKVGEIPPVKVGDIPGINQTPRQALVDALKKAPILHPEQKAMYAKEYGEKFTRAEEAGQRLGGEAGFIAARGEMKGKMATVDFESIAEQINPYRDALKQDIWDNPYLRTGERFQAEAGLDRLIAGNFPAPKQTELLNRVFGPELVDALIGKKQGIDKFKYWAKEFANVPRSIMASFDLSAPLRQGVFLIGRPRLFLGSLKDMVSKFWVDEQAYHDFHRSLTTRPTFNLMKDSGLALTEIGSSLAKTEEQFMGVPLIERFGQRARQRFPGVLGKILDAPGQAMLASQRAYTGFLNKLRADTFDSLVKDAKELGLYDTAKGEANLGMNRPLSTAIADYVNAATGRGRLPGTLESGAAVLNATFFSPRLMASRLHLLNPRTYVGLPKPVRTAAFGKAAQPAIPKFVRQAALKDMLRLGAVYATAVTLAKMGGAEVGDDPTSADFTKIKIGNTRIEIGGGFGNYIRLLAQMALNKTTSSTTGKVTELGKGYKATTRKDVLFRFFESKENPVVSFFSGLLDGRDFTGQPFNAPREVWDRFSPMLFQDILDMIEDDPDVVKTASIAMTAVFGAGVQTYDNKTGKKKGKLIR